ncbi:Zinc C2H2 [Cordyceps militaris]|uniref:Zinc C2H2 n=1 Tax=Cordyceps militaris TaxID=73501 RepID=A0A2H4SR60_CORMI|nr:Zinc C2H2 [Cordyceps militaris]
MLAQNPPNNLQFTLPAVNQLLTFDDLRSLSPAHLEESAQFASDASSCHSTMPHAFVYNTPETSHFDAVTYDSKNTTLQGSVAYSLPLSSPTQSLLSHSIESDFPMESSHGPSTPEEWSAMLSDTDRSYQQTQHQHQHPWNGGVAPYYDGYAAPDMSCSSIQASQMAHLGAGFENQPNMHPSDDLLTTTTSSAYPAFVSMAPLPYGRDLSHSGSNSSVPRGFSQHSDAFSGLLVPSIDSDARHSSPSSFSTGDDATTNTRASSVSVPRKRQSREMKRQQRRPSPVSVGRASHTILPYPTPSSATPTTLPSMRTLAENATPECMECKQTFRDVPTLQKHVKSEHTRPLLCVFHYAGCTSRFPTKNEWKRHVASQHLALRYWICIEGTCGQTRGPSTRSRARNLPAFGSIFNRKDLYTQHIRRMHTGASEGGSPVLGSSKKSVPSEVEDRVRALQANAARTRCVLPHFMRCPAPNCPSEFHGPNAWDDRMEHVACHLERAAAGEEAPVFFGGPGDETLTKWAAADGVNVTRQTADGTWTLCNPLRGEGGGNSRGGRSRASVSSAATRRASMARHTADEEDAEGEDCTSWSRS